MSSSESDLLTIRHLTVAYRSADRFEPALSDLSLEIHTPETVGLVGESGSGKTTLARTLLGLLPASAAVRSGKINFKDQDLLALGQREWRRIRGREIGMIFQEPTAALNPVMRVETQLCEGMIHHFGWDRKYARRKAADLLGEVGIARPLEVLDSYPFQLSGGMCQRVLIAAALSCKPALLICDEPTSALDVTVRNQLLKLLKRLQSQYEFSILFISHDLPTIRLVSDRILVLREGQLEPFLDEPGPSRAVLPVGKGIQ